VKSKKTLFLTAAALVAAGLVVVLLVLQAKEDVDVAETGAATRPENHRADISSGSEAASPDTGVKSRRKRTARLPQNAIDRKKRAEILALILSALQAKERETGKRHSRESLKPAGLPAEYIQEAVREIVPLLKECYHMELEERGTIRGKVVLGFDLVADDEHGGLVEEASILESELSKEISDSFAECLRESVYALRLDAPEWGGRHTVRYPLYFSAIGHDD
jgi:hypothetical protein